jgi:hypothetical protein
VSFFEPPPPPPEPPDAPQPPWVGPPENELGEAVPLRVVLVRRDDLALAVTDVVAYRTGCALRVVLRRRAPADGPDPFYAVHHAPRRGGLPDEQLRFGVELADGRRATNVGGPGFGREPGPRDAVLVPRGGGGGGRSWDQSFWLWPLPPPGPLALVVEWPSEGVELTRVEVDAAPILEAAARSERLWDDDDFGGGWAPAAVVFTR